MNNVLLVGLIEEDLKKIGLLLAQRLEFFYLNSEEMISYSLFDKAKMEKVCGINYMKEEERKVVFGLNTFERTVLSMSYETFSNNFDAISSSNTIIYLRQTEGQFNKRVEELLNSGIETENLHNYEISRLVFNQRDNFLKKNCNLIVKYDISKLDSLIENLEDQILEKEWKLNKNVSMLQGQ